MESAELKIVLHLWGGRALVGIQQKDTDPVVEPVQGGTLDEVLAAVPGLVARARERWATSPRNPTYDRPTPPPSPAPTQPVARPAGRMSSSCPWPSSGRVRLNHR